MPPLLPDAAEVQVQLSQAQREALQRHVATIQEFQSKSVEAAVALAAIKDERLYVEDGSFPDFARRHFGFRRRWAYQLAQSGRAYSELHDLGVDPLPQNEGQLRALTQLESPDDKAAAWQAALDASGGDARTVTSEAVTLAATRIELGERPLRSVAALGDEVQLAAVELAMGETVAPVSDLREVHADLLDLLDPRDEAAVWQKLLSYPTRQSGVEYDADDGRIARAKRSAIRRAIRDVAQEHQLRTDRPPPASELQVLVREHLLDADLASSLTDRLDDDSRIGPSILAPYAETQDAVANAIEHLDAGDAWPEEEWCFPDEIAAMRAMTRSRLEPELATWVWAVLIPAPKRSARTWFPDPDAPAPCYVPARLRQPERTVSSNLDRRLTTATTALLAPGVDLMREDMPEEIAVEILSRAGAATGFAFLAATNHPERASQQDWPDNVHVCLRVSGQLDGAQRSPTASVTRALSPFRDGDRRVVLVLDDVALLLQQEALDLIADASHAVILRGSGTSQAFYDQMLGLRSENVAFVQTSDVRRRPAFAFMAVPPPEVAHQPEGGRAVAIENAALPRPTAEDPTA